MSRFFTREAVNLMGRIALFGASFTVLVNMLLLIGNIQQFTERSQLLLLHVLQYSGIMTAICLLYYCILLMKRDIRQQFNNIGLRIVLSLFGIVIGLGLSLAAQFIRLVLTE